MPHIQETSDPFGEGFATLFDDREHYTEVREILTSSLEQICAEASLALQQSSFNFQLFLMVPATGNSMLSVATPADPSDEDWSRATDIVIDIVKRKTGMQGLCARERPCAATDAPIDAVEISLPSADLRDPI
jgi:hypothetical protein